MLQLVPLHWLGTRKQPKAISHWSAYCETFWYQIWMNEWKKKWPFVKSIIRKKTYIRAETANINLIIRTSQKGSFKIFYIISEEKFMMKSFLYKDVILESTNFLKKTCIKGDFLRNIWHYPKAALQNVKYEPHFLFFKQMRNKSTQE